MTTNEQHFLVNLEPYRQLLSTLDLSDFTVLEFGVGNGELTNLILERNPKKVIGYEIDPTLNFPTHPNFELRLSDFTNESFEFIKNEKVAIISNPPYSTIPFIKDQIIDRYQLNHVVMMLPSKLKSLFPNSKEAIIFQGDDFRPVSKGTHHVSVLWKGI